MAATSSMPGPLAPFLEPVLTSPQTVVLLLLIGVVAVLIYAHQPPLPQTAVLAFVPWLVSGAILTVLAGSLGYPPALHPVFVGLGAYLTALAVPAIAWLAMLAIPAASAAVPAYHHYLGAMGTGTMLVLAIALVTNAGDASLTTVAVLLFVPILALFATGIIGYTAVFWAPDFGLYTAITGGFAIFGWLVNALSTVLGVGMTGTAAHTPFSTTVRDIVLVTLPNGVAGLTATQLWASLFVLANVAIGIHVATQLAPYAEDGPRAVRAMQGGVGVLGFVLGVNTLVPLVVA